MSRVKVSLKNICRQVFALHGCFAGKVLLLWLPRRRPAITELACASQNNVTCHLLCFENSFQLQQKKAVGELGSRDKQPE